MKSTDVHYPACLWSRALREPTRGNLAQYRLPFVDRPPPGSRRSCLPGSRSVSFSPFLDALFSFHDVREGENLFQFWVCRRERTPQTISLQGSHYGHPSEALQCAKFSLCSQAHIGQGPPGNWFVFHRPCLRSAIVRHAETATQPGLPTSHTTAVCPLRISAADSVSYSFG